MERLRQPGRGLHEARRQGAGREELSEIRRAETNQRKRGGSVEETRSGVSTGTPTLGFPAIFETADLSLDEHQEPDKSRTQLTSRARPAALIGRTAPAPLVVLPVPADQVVLAAELRLCCNRRQK